MCCYTVHCVIHCLFWESLSIYINLEVTVWFELEFLQLLFPLCFSIMERTHLDKWFTCVHLKAGDPWIQQWTLLRKYNKRKGKTSNFVPEKDYCIFAELTFRHAGQEYWQCWEVPKSCLAFLTLTLTYWNFTEYLLIYVHPLKWCSNYGKTLFYSSVSLQIKGENKTFHWGLYSVTCLPVGGLFYLLISPNSAT